MNTAGYYRFIIHTSTRMEARTDAHTHTHMYIMYCMLYKASKFTPK